MIPFLLLQLKETEENDDGRVPGIAAFECSSPRTALPDRAVFLDGADLVSVTPYFSFCGDVPNFLAGLPDFAIGGQVTFFLSTDPDFTIGGDRASLVAANPNFAVLGDLGDFGTAHFDNLSHVSCVFRFRWFCRGF